ncbi:thymidine kinase [Halodesulfurarchaeum sp.]|uniref:thymidine kinase n=1 Tax=Halodesulfurarchaeum sp. TaxID=1980530 RepID=UPI001BBB62F9|nr:thymidine kinase [Halodesulfurarchaeum sp.]
MRAIRENGWVEVISGSMFSGKTEELLRRLRRTEIAGQSVAAFTPAIDDRYGQAELGSHAGHTWEATVVDNTPDGVRSIPNRLDGESVVAIDEANFFPVEIVTVIDDLANEGRRVIVSGTDQTFRGEPFEPLGQLMANAEYVDKLRAICAVCGEPATRNQRLVDGEPAHIDEPTIQVGAEETYEARCRNCHEVRRD